MEEVIEKVKGFGRASGPRWPANINEWKLHIASSKAALASACADVGLNFDGSMLVQVTLDTTPVSVRQRHTVSVVSSKRARSSKGLVDVLVGACSLSRVEGTGEITSRLLLDEPIILRGGKTKEMMAACFLVLP
eukprot:6375843-Amphidinium_carterae.1